MWIPFSKQISNLFESRRGLVLKLVVGAAVGLILGISLSVRLATESDLKHSPWIVYAALIAGSLALSVFLVFVLYLKDSVRLRVESGERVNAALRLLLASGFVSLAIWVSIAVATALAIAAALS